ncbi:hypothetical protein NBRC3188_0086 [Acetobacter pasteurianus NBRC 3188]|uniref:Uncharacterized protein n=1 Tax=Acetobacter pasteurianus NBRC 3188 TaxID=1226663 RepID=A0A401WPZ7_ACEPA|nr:hypothetical protein NBRC3188_0086 [Acetobacter pasteurianus NBRC 3188]
MLRSLAMGRNDLATATRLIGLVLARQLFTPMLRCKGAQTDPLIDAIGRGWYNSWYSLPTWMNFHLYIDNYYQYKNIIGILDKNPQDGSRHSF